MKNKNVKNFGFKLGVLASAISISTLAIAQESQEVNKNQKDDVDEIIVTGARGAMKSAEAIKRSASTIVDSITSDDMGAFPDKSIAEALQRVPGVTINRFAASDDTSHFSAEPSGILVRGLTHTSTLVNGRDSFSANSSRGLSFADISPELMSGVDTYKNSTADLIEGGIAGTVNLRTRLPFDYDGQVFQGSLNLNYGDLRKESTPEGSVLYSNRWDTSVGEFGFLANFSYSDLATSSQAVQYRRIGVYENVFIDEAVDEHGNRVDENGAILDPVRRYIPSGIQNLNTDYDRERTGKAFAIQFTNSDRTFDFSLQYLDSKYQETWNERSIASMPADLWGKPGNFVFTPGGNSSNSIPIPAPGSPGFTFNDEGDFQSGVINGRQQDNIWWGIDNDASKNIVRNDQGEAMLNVCYTWKGCSPDAKAPDFQTVSRYDRQNRSYNDFSAHAQWHAADNFKLNFDVQHVEAESDGYNAEVALFSFANVSLNTERGRPQFELLAPTNINQSKGGLANANNYRYNHAMDHLDEADGEQTAIRLDAEYAIGLDWFDTLAVGARYAKREQVVKYSAWNWGNISNVWNSDSGQYRWWNIDKTESVDLGNGKTFNGYNPHLYQMSQFGNDFFNNGTSTYAFFNKEFLKPGALSALSYDTLGAGQDQWNPICSGGGNSQFSGRLQESDGCFRKDEINNVTETTEAFYAMLKYGGPSASIFGTPVSGNVGFRYIQTVDDSDGYIVFPNKYSVNPTSAECTTPLPEPLPGQPALVYGPHCYLSGEDLAFASGLGESRTASTTHHHILPSFNINFGLDEHLMLRFAWSKALSRPDIGYLKNYVSIRSELPAYADFSDERYIKDATGKVTGVKPTYLASAYNPKLKPITANQLDISLENYFEDGGMLSLATFYKNYDDFIQYGTRTETVSNQGVTRQVTTTGPLNGDGAAVYGAEVNYQKFFTNLPGGWSGLGMQINASVIENEAVNPSLKALNGGDGGGAQTTADGGGVALKVDDLEGVSKYNYNLVAMYEKYGISARLAYNWRSKYLITAVDCCTSLPTYNEATGYLDGSITYSFTPEVQVSLSGSNLLDTQPNLSQQVDDASEGGTLKKSAWLRNDRRFVLGLRAKF